MKIIKLSLTWTTCGLRFFICIWKKCSKKNFSASKMKIFHQAPYQLTCKWKSQFRVIWTNICQKNLISAVRTPFLLVKNPHFWLDNPEIENLPLIYLPIYKKIFVSGLPSRKCGFFTNKPKISKICFVSEKSTFLTR